jgi:hypothetical protein
MDWELLADNDYYTVKKSALWKTNEDESDRLDSWIGRQGR